MGFYFSTKQIQANQKLEQRTLDFSVSVVKFLKQFPYSYEHKIIFSQLLRSSSSIGANYREANEACSKKDFAYRLRIVRREAKETIYWLAIVKASCGEGIALSALQNEASQLFKIFCKILSNINHR